MKPNILKLILTSFVTAAGLLTTQAHAQAKVAVPFPFYIGGHTYPSGTYFLNRNFVGPFVALENKDGREIYRWALGPGDATPTNSTVGMIFDEVQNQHILRAIQYRSLVTARLDETIRKHQRALSASDQGE